MSAYRRITLSDVKESDEARALIGMQSAYLETLGYTEHGVRHVSYVSKTTANILRETGADERLIELGEIAGWLHDVGNSLSRAYHGLTGGALAYAGLAGMQAVFFDAYPSLAAAPQAFLLPFGLFLLIAAAVSAAAIGIGMLPLIFNTKGDVMGNVGNSRNL